MPQTTDPCRPPAGSNLLAGFTTNYDKAGNKLFERHLHSECRSHAYQYDTANRLSQYQRGNLSDPGAWPTSPLSAPSPSLTLSKALSEIGYNLDLLGNWASPSLTSADGSTPPSDSRTHNALNQITQRGGKNLTYDKNGNLLNDGRLRYQYDALNRLRRVYLMPSTLGDDVTMASDVELLLVEYTYDALGRRIRRDIKDLGGGYGGVSGRVKAGVTLFLYAGNQCIEEREGTDLTTPARQYVWGHYVDELVQQREYNTPVGTCDLYPVQDLHNRTVAITDCCGSIAETYDTDAYGRTIVFADPGVDSQWFTNDDQQVPVPLCRFLYTGREYDAETGMYFYRARYYSTELGRFISRDPIGYAGGSPNLYVYSSGNPINRVDPSGNYDTAGHFWTVYMMAVASGVSKRDAYRLAYYAQLPDQVSAFDAETAFKDYLSTSRLQSTIQPNMDVQVRKVLLEIADHNLRWDYDVEDYLHSLMPGTKKDLLQRRRRLASLFRNNPEFPVWEKGFILHAYGDTFAHADANGDPYPPYLGHGVEGHTPDAIGESPSRYKQYLTGLTSLLANGHINTAKLSKISSLAATFQVPSWPGKGEVLLEDREIESLARRKFGYSWRYVPDDSYNQEPAMGPAPTRDQVQQLIDLIKNAK